MEVKRTYVKSYVRKRHGRAKTGGRVSGYTADRWVKGAYEVHVHTNPGGGHTHHIHLKLEHPGDTKYESYVLPKHRFADKGEKLFMKYMGKYPKSAITASGKRKGAFVASKGEFEEKDGLLKFGSRVVKIVPAGKYGSRGDKLMIGVRSDVHRGKYPGIMTNTASDLGLLSPKQNLTNLTNRESEILARELSKRMGKRSARALFNSKYVLFKNKNPRFANKMRHGRDAI